MAIRITRKPLKSEQFVALLVQCDGIPDKTITIHLDSLADGRTTIAKEIERAKTDAETRSNRAQAALQALSELRNL